MYVSGRAVPGQAGQQVQAAALVTNYGRHLNHIAVVLDADTFEIQELASIFDNGSGQLPFVVEEDLLSYEMAIAYATGKGPVFYGSFFQTVRHVLDRSESEPVRRFLIFTFPQGDAYALPEWRICALEEYVR